MIQDKTIKDITVPGFKDSGSMTLHTDTNFIDSIIYNIKDSCITKDKVKETILKHSKHFLKSDSLIVDDSLIYFKALYHEGKWSHNYHVKDRVIKDTSTHDKFMINPDGKRKYPSIFWLVIGLFIGFIGGIILSILYFKK